MKMLTKTITPLEAADLLAGNHENRSLRVSLVSKYARDMRAGQWILNGQAIILNGNGTLLDGQHRLAACVEADTPFETVLITGVGSEAMATLDTGIARTLADQLGFEGLPNPKALSSAVGWMMRYDYMVEDGSKSLSTIAGKRTRQEMLAYIEANPSLVDSVAVAVDCKPMIAAAPVGLIAMIHHLIRRSMSFEAANRFVGELVDPALSEPGSPPALLRKWLLEHQTRYSKPPLEVIAAIMVKAARLWANGETLDRLLWRKSGKDPEPFPIFEARHVGSQGGGKGYWYVPKG